MTAEAFAELLQARPRGAGRWQAKCPAHPDRNPSLSIATGRDGRTLIRCWAGCATADVLKSLGLSMRDLYAGPPPSPAQATQLAAERAKCDAEATAVRRQHRELADRYRRLSCVCDALGDRLAHLPEDAPEGDAIARLFHKATEMHRDAESALEVTR